MTKTEESLKSLAEFGQKFIGGESWSIKGINLDEESLFYNEDTASILAHLALKEMGKRRFDVSYMTFLSAGTLIHHYFFSERNHRTTKRQAIKDENNFIALWSAIEQTGEK